MKAEEEIKTPCSSPSSAGHGFHFPAAEAEPGSSAWAVTTVPGLQGDIVKQGYLGKQRQSHKRYFVLRAESHTGPRRVEWYKTKDKFQASDKSSRKTTHFHSSKHRVIYLSCCIGVSRTNGSQKEHVVTLYAGDQTLVLVMEDQWEQVEWYLSIKKLLDDEHEDMLEEEDDGYCTLPPAAFFKEVWPVTVKPRDLGRSKGLAGAVRLCLTASALTLIQMGEGSTWRSVKIPLMSVRRFGHLDNSFFLELGRSAPNGPGEIWMEARDQGNQAMAQNIHEAVREAVKALRILPDFRTSPVSNNIRQTPVLSKSGKAKCREKSVHVRPLFLLPDPQLSSTQWTPEPGSPDVRQTEWDSRRSPSVPEPDGYMDMQKDDRRAGCSSPPTGEDDRAAAACGVESWDSWEEEGLTDITSGPSREDYEVMDSPERRHWPAHSLSASSLLMAFHSSASVTCFDSSDHQYVVERRSLSRATITDEAIQELPPMRGRPLFTLAQDFSPLEASQSVAHTSHHPSSEHDDPAAVSPAVPGRRRRLSSCLPFCL